MIFGSLGLTDSLGNQLLSVAMLALKHLFNPISGKNESVFSVLAISFRHSRFEKCELCHWKRWRRYRLP